MLELSTLRFLGYVILNSNDMETQLTNKEKKCKRAEARRRAILWSEREIRKRQLKRTQAKVETITISDKTESENLEPFKSSATILSEFSNITQQRHNEGTVVSLRNTIKNLQIQRQELDTTIKVLNNYLNQILSTSKTNFLKRNKRDGH